MLFPFVDDGDRVEIVDDDESEPVVVEGVSTVEFRVRSYHLFEPLDIVWTILSDEEMHLYVSALHWLDDEGVCGVHDIKAVVQEPCWVRRVDHDTTS